MRSLTAVIHLEDDLWVALCPEIGTSSQGHNIDEAVANLGEATKLYLEEFPTNKMTVIVTKNIKDQRSAGLLQGVPDTIIVKGCRGIEVQDAEWEEELQERNPVSVGEAASFDAVG